jgi:hypothetical protein
LAEIGLTAFQIMSFNGWKSLRQVQDYTKGMKRNVAADQGAEKIEAAHKKNKRVPPFEGGAESGTN